MSSKLFSPLLYIMVFKRIDIEQPSARVLGKLRKGGKVRIGCGLGMGLVIDADKYNQVTKSFGKGKAYTISLSPEEIHANMNPPAEVGQMEGKGIFDTIGKKIKKGVQQLGEKLKPVGRKIKKGVEQIGTRFAPEVLSSLGSAGMSGLALMAGQPELMPVASALGSQLGKVGGKALQRGTAPPSRRPDATAVQQVANIASSQVGMANLGQYLQSLDTAQLEMEIARRRGGGYSSPFDESGGRQVLAPYTDAVGQGLYAGASRGSGFRKKSIREKASIGIHGNLLGHGLPPALQSQPYSANFQMASRLPPAFSSLFHSGKGLYA